MWLNFWATWCPPCQSETPVLRDMDEAYGDKGLAIVGIAVQETTPEDVQAYADRYELGYDIAFDASADIFDLYKVYALPTQFFIDPSGKILEVVNGPMTDASAQARIDAWLPKDARPLGRLTRPFRWAERRPPSSIARPPLVHRGRPDDGRDARGDPMRYVMLTFQGDEHLAAWEAATPEERRLEIERTIAWFREHGAEGRIVGGEELGEPKAARTVRRGGLVTDGPFAETKEHLGGFIVLEVPDSRRRSRSPPAGPGLDWATDGVSCAGRRLGRRRRDHAGLTPPSAPTHATVYVPRLAGGRSRVRSARIGSRIRSGHISTISTPNRAFSSAPCPGSAYEGDRLTRYPGQRSRNTESSWGRRASPGAALGREAASVG